MNKLLFFYHLHPWIIWEISKVFILESLSSRKQKSLRIHILWLFSSYFCTSIVVSKFLLSTLLHSLYAMRIFSCRRARLSLKEAFRVIFARNCNDRGVVAASLLRQSFSLPATLSSSSHLFSSFSFSLSIYLFFFATASVCGPATLPRCQYRHLEIICSSVHFWARCDRNCTVKVVPSEFLHSSISRTVSRWCVNPLTLVLTHFVKKIFLGREKDAKFLFRKPVPDKTLELESWFQFK